MTQEPNPRRPPYPIAAMLCSHVFDKTKPVLLVVRCSDIWQLLCGDVHDDSPRLVHVGHLLQRDPTLVEVLDLQVGWEASREAPDTPWTRQPSPEETW